MKILENLNIFNFLRGISAFFIIVWHTFWITQMVHPEIHGAPYFYLPVWPGVWIFFAVSGYLIGKGFFSNKYKTDTPKDFLNFYIQRAIRILPLYFLIVFIDLFFVNTGGYLNPETQLLQRAFTLTLRAPYLDGMIGSLWFVCVLVQLYIIAPFVNLLIVKPIKKFKNKKIIIAGLMFLLIIVEYCLRNYLLGKIDWASYIYENVAYNIDIFFCGFLFNFFTQENTNEKTKIILQPYSLILFAAFCIGNVICMQKHWMLDTWDLKVLYPTLTILITLFLIYVFDTPKIKKENELNKKEIIFQLFNPFKWLEALGLISMGFFISHAQTISNLAKIIYVKDDTVLYSYFFGLLIKPLKITFSISLKTLWIVLLLAILFSIMWGIIIRYFFEIPLNKYRYSLVKEGKNNEQTKG